jgi:hypothetical protein
VAAAAPLASQICGLEPGNLGKIHYVTILLCACEVLKFMKLLMIRPDQTKSLEATILYNDSSDYIPANKGTFMREHD